MGREHRYNFFQEKSGIDRRYSIADERSRARKGADGRTPAEKPGQDDSPRRAVDCAPYLNSAPLL